MSARYITVAEAAEILCIHPRTVTRFLTTGKLRGAKVGRSWRLDEKDVRDFFENLKEETAKAIQEQKK
jgi:excisionase family DNA binding protein